MSQRVDISQYFTRNQSDQRYLKRPQTPEPPVSLALDSTGIIEAGGDFYAYLDITVTPPATPSWAGASQYVQAYEFVVSYTIGNPVTKHFIVPFVPGDVYRVEPLPTGVAVEISAYLIDYLGQKSALSDPLSTSTAADSVPPLAPLISGTAIDAGAQVKIVSVNGVPDTINTEPDFDIYELWRGQGPNLLGIVWEASPLFRFLSTVANDISVPVSATDYYYKVVARDFSGNQATSNIVGPLTLESTAVDPPPVVDMGAASAVPQDDGLVQINWPPVVDPELAFYRLWRKKRISSGPDAYEAEWTLVVQFGAQSGTPSPVTYVDDRVEDGSAYRWTVTAVNTSGDESAFPSGYVEAVASDIQVPDAVPAITPMGRIGGVYFVWTVSSSADVVGYKVSYRLTSLSGWQPDVIVLGNSHTFLGITTSRDELANQLEIRVIAVDDAGNESTPTIRGVTYPELAGYQPADTTIPASPSTLAASVITDGSVVLSWPASQSSDRSGYSIEKFDTLASSWEFVTTTLDDQPGTKTYRVLGLEPFEYRGRQYRFRVRTVDKSGNISPANLAENPSFDSSLSNWTNATDSGWVAASVALSPRSGAAALNVNYAGRVYQDVPVAEGLFYTFSAYLREDPTSTGGRGRLEVDWLTSGLGILGSINSGGLYTADSNYHRLEVTGKAPATAVFARVRLVGDSGNVTKKILFDDVQVEIGAGSTIYADAKTSLVSAADITPPADYAASLGFSATGALGQIKLRWKNPDAVFAGAYEYINSTFEIWRKVTVSSQPSLPVDSDFRKIAEVQGGVGPVLPDVAWNAFDDNDPEESYNVTAQYKLKARDRYRNISSFLNADTAVSAVSKTPNDLNIPRKDGLLPSTPTVNGVTGAVANNDGTVTVSWTGSSTSGRNDLLGYRVLRDANASGVYQVIGFFYTATESGSHSYIDNGIELSGSSTVSSYTYKVQAVDTAEEESSLSGASNSVVPVDNRTPAAPTNVTGKGTVGGLLLRWTGSTTFGVTVYEIFVPAVAGENAQVFRVTGATALVMLHGGPNASTAAALAITVKAVSRSGGALSTAATMTTINSDEMYSYIPVDRIAPGIVTPGGTPVTNYTSSTVNGSGSASDVSITFPSSSHGFKVGDLVYISAPGMSAIHPSYQVAYNGYFEITTVIGATIYYFVGSGDAGHGD